MRKEMKQTFFIGSILSLLSLLFFVTGCKQAPKLVISNPVDIEFGDPYVLHVPGDKFYIYGTSGINGFKVYSSTDLSKWTDEGQIYTGGTDSSWNTDCFWAPEVYNYKDKYYLFFSANWKDNPTKEEENFRIGVAVSDSPKGPFKDISDSPIFDPGYPIIDANVWFDPNGKIYLYYSRCCYKHPVDSEVAQWAKEKGWYDEIEESWIYGIEIKPDFSGVVGEPVLLLRPPVTIDDKQAEWESRSVTSKEVNRRWTEGSYLLKKGNTYYMMYSANFYGGENYAVGYATSGSPLGPFIKADNNPVLQKQGAVKGTGHNSVLALPDGQLFCVYHGRTQKTGQQRVVFIDKMEIKEDKTLSVDGPTLAK